MGRSASSSTDRTAPRAHTPAPGTKTTEPSVAAAATGDEGSAALLLADFARDLERRRADELHLRGEIGVLERIDERPRVEVRHTGDDEPPVVRVQRRRRVRRARARTHALPHDSTSRCRAALRSRTLSAASGIAARGSASITL